MAAEVAAGAVARPQETPTAEAGRPGPLRVTTAFPSRAAEILAAGLARGAESASEAAG